MTTINNNEMKVLNACAKQIEYETGGEFSFTDFVKLEGFTKEQLKGYFSQLSQKGLIWIADDCQYGFTKSGCEFSTEETSHFDTI